jgi:hypothetical protein
MDVESLAKQLILKGMTEEQQKAILDSIKTTMTQARTLQKQRVGENVQVVVQALKKIEADIRSRYDEVGNKIEKRVATIKDGKDGLNGVNGKDGKDGRPGRDGGQGPRGNDGLNGNDGRDGEDGVSVTDAHIDFDGSLVISLSSGRTINVGEVVAPDLAEKIKVITNGGGTSQGVLDTLASLQTQIDNIPGGGDVVGPASATDSSLVAFNGTTGKLIKQAATVTVAQGGTGTASPALVAGTNVTITGAWPNQTINASGGGGTVTSVDVSGGTTGLTTSGGPVTTSGTITLAGTLAIANGGTGQTTAAAAITALTGTQTSGQYLRSNGTNAVLAAIQAADVPTLNQNTTGTAANVTGTVAVANGGTGATTRQAAMDALAGSTTSGQYLRGDGTDVVMSAIQAADVPTLNQSTTGNAATATVFQTSRNINGVAFNGSADITVADATKLPLAGGTMTGAITFVGGQTFPGTGDVTLTGTQTLTNKTLTSPVVTQNIQVISGNTTAVRSRTYVFTATLTLTLPSSPTAGDEVKIVNSSGTTTPVIGRNGSNIMSLAEDMTVDKAAGASFTLVYADATRGWVINL